MDDIIDKIAKDYLYIKSLKERNIDSADFVDVHVGLLRRALVAAYNEGKKEGTNNEAT